MDTGSFETCLYVGILVLILVVVVPAVDAFLCRKIGLNPVRGKNRTLKSNRVYVIRRIEFGDVKRNWGFRRFTLRGIEKVAHEWRLLMMGHNIRKLARKIAGAAANPATA